MSSSTSEEPILRVRNLTIQFRAGRRVFRAVEDVSFDLHAGETLGIVGESGSGKTTLARAILGLVPITSGSIEFQGRDITHATRRARRELAPVLQAVFQDPYSSFNPALKIGTSLTEAILATGTPRPQARARMIEMLGRVGMSESAADQYPGAFSGGQRQRLSIARALMGSPALVLCDEPVSALDVSIQAQVLNLLRHLRDEDGLSYLLIGHDLDVMRYMSDRLLVLYHGHVMESGRATDVVSDPQSPYTRALVSATSSLAVEDRQRRQGAAGQVGAGAVGQRACPFVDRCPDATDICEEAAPELEAAGAATYVACHHPRPQAVPI